MNWRLIIAMTMVVGIFGLMAPSTAAANPLDSALKGLVEEPLSMGSSTTTGALMVGVPLGMTAIYLIFGRRGPITEPTEMNLEAMKSDEFARKLEISRVVDPHTPQAPVVFRIVSLRF